MTDVAVRTIATEDHARWLPSLAALRIAVFREYPYLYDGAVAYEERYLRRYAETNGSVIVGAFDGDTLVGAATGVPLEAEPAEVVAPFVAAGEDLAQWFYFGESVLLPQWRGHGLGHRFFDAREAHAAALGFGRTCFCRVDRPDDHPRRPADFRPLDAFWRRRGYAPLPGYLASMSWRDLDETGESAKPMSFWGRRAP